MDLSLYQIDAFAQRPFTGNPAAVVPLSTWLSDEQLQLIAMENNLSETAFFVPRGNEFHIRWFTPASEVNLCGHATLASAYVILRMLGGGTGAGAAAPASRVVFQSQSGPLIVTEEDGRLVLDFPAWVPLKMEQTPAILREAFRGADILGVYENRDLLVELEDEDAVKAVQPDFGLLKKLRREVIVTAQGREADFVSRFFAPFLGIDEDPVTGSAHTQLIPYWGEKLGKKRLFARQLSKRGGELWCSWNEDRVGIGGHCSFFMKGTISIP